MVEIGKKINEDLPAYMFCRNYACKKESFLYVFMTPKKRGVSSAVTPFILPAEFLRTDVTLARIANQVDGDLSANTSSL